MAIGVNWDDLYFDYLEYVAEKPVVYGKNIYWDEKIRNKISFIWGFVHDTNGPFWCTIYLTQKLVIILHKIFSNKKNNRWKKNNFYDTNPFILLIISSYVRHSVGMKRSSISVTVNMRWVYDFRHVVLTGLSFKTLRQNRTGSKLDQFKLYL